MLLFHPHDIMRNRVGQDLGTTLTVHVPGVFKWAEDMPHVSEGDPVWTGLLLL